MRLRVRLACEWLVERVQQRVDDVAHTASSPGALHSADRPVRTCPWRSDSYAAAHHAHGRSPHEFSHAFAMSRRP